MTAEMILFIILNLLRADNATNLDNPQVHQHLVEVSQAIHTHATSTVPAERLISLAYNESRFGYRYVLKGTYPKSSWNACGIYQQVPRFSRIETTCERLGTNVNHATEVAVAYLDYMIDRWSIRGSRKMDTRMCHYYSGNKCDAEARAYSRRHRKVRLKALKLKSKARRATKARTTTHTARSVRKITKDDLFSGLPTRKKTRQEMTREEWLYALHNEQDEKRRAELGLPPNRL